MCGCETDRQTETERDRDTDRDTDRQTDRQTEKTMLNFEREREKTMLNFDHDHMPWSLKTGLISLGKLLTEESMYSGRYSSTVTVAAQTAPCGKYVFAQAPHQSSFCLVGQ